MTKLFMATRIALAIVVMGGMSACSNGNGGSWVEYWVDVQRPYDHQWMHCYGWDRSRTCDWDHPWT